MKTISKGQSELVLALMEITARYPDRQAIVDGESIVSFRDLWASIEHRTDALLAAGVQPGNRIALIAESSADFLATAFAVWRAGGVLVTIYPSSGPEDMGYAIEKSDPVLLVASAAVEQSLPEHARSFPVVDIADFHVTHIRNELTPSPEGLREPLSLICFSSGTTNRPKAIMLSSRAIFNCADTYGEAWHLSPEDKAIICLPMAWLMGLATTSLAVLLRGGTLVIVRRARPELIAPAIEKNSATFLAGVTATFAKLAQYAEEKIVEHPAFPSLRLCISGGEPRNEAAFARWEAQTGLPVFDSYCASECLPLVAYDPLSDPTPRLGSAGRVLPRSLLKIVAPDGTEVPQGEIGEAYSSGPGLMLGYWGDEQQTRAAVTEDGWYRTKDLVRMDDDGYVYVVGRISEVIIRGGMNISPAEVERTLHEHPSVGEAAVVGIPDEIYGQRVVAAIVPVRGMQIDPDELRQFTASRLSSYKVPSDFVKADSLPVNVTTGKINRREVAAQIAAESPLGS